VVINTSPLQGPMLDKTDSASCEVEQATRERKAREQFAAGLRGHIRAAVRGEDRKQRTKQRKLDEQAQRDKEAAQEDRERKQVCERVRRWRALKKAKQPPKLTMTALAKALCLSRRRLEQFGLRAAMLRGVKTKSATPSRWEATEIAKRLLASIGGKLGKTLRTKDMPRNDRYRKCETHALPRQETENLFFFSRAAPNSAAAAPLSDSPQLLQRAQREGSNGRRISSSACASSTGFSPGKANLKPLGNLRVIKIARRVLPLPQGDSRCRS
jgi:hypothetical protein